jgi:UDP-glucose 4-epimerase
MDSINAYYGGAKVMVTGGLGFIGSNLARRLVGVGAEVVVVDSLLPNAGANCANLKDIEDKLTICIADVRNAEKMAALMQGCNVVFNLAGTVSHLDSMTDPLPDMGANVHAPIVLLEACRRCAPGARVVFASTRQIYGRPISCPVDENHPIRPVDVNGIHKVAAESYHTLYHQVYGMQTVSLRLTNTYGPRMRIKDGRQTFLGIWVRRVLEGSAFEVWGGQQKRDLTYVDDAVEAFLIAGVNPGAQGRVFNIGGGPPVTLIALADSLVAASQTGRYEIMEFPAERLRIDIGDYFADDRLFRELTNWSPSVSLQEGLVRTLDYFRNCLSEYV